MDCTHARTELSARLDGEALGVPVAALDTHLAGCAGCRAFAQEAEALHRGLRVQAIAPVPDLTADVLAAIGRASTPPPAVEALRVGLAVVGLVQIGLALPSLLLGEDAGLPVHTARHLGSFAVALAVGFLVAAWRPNRIAGLLAVTAALVACFLVTSALDVAAGRTALTNEAGHATELVGLGLLWCLARTSGQGRRSRRIALS
jgi:predicted anti-sigma-YlaC factor YlaD